MGTGELYYRESFKKEGIPPLFYATREKTYGRAKTAADLAVQRWRNKHLGVADDQVFGRGRVTTTFATVIERVLADDTDQWRSGTQAMRRYYLEELREAFGSEDVNAITRERFRDQVRKWQKTRKRRTYSDFAKYMNVALRYAYSEMKVAEKLTTVAVTDPPTPPGRVYSRKELRLLWEAMRVNLRDQFVLSYECYMRLREALRLTWDRVDLKTGKVTLRAEDVKTGTKTKKGREFVVSTHALERLRARHDRRGKRDRTRLSPYVFPSRFDPAQPQHDNKTAWTAAKRAAGITGRARWHDLRHTAITHALERDTNIAKLSDFAGVSVRTLQRIYMHLKASSTKDVSNVLHIGGEE